MKPFIWSITGTLIFCFIMVAWSVAGKMMTTGGDMGVLKGLLIMAGIIGLGGSGAVYGARQIMDAIDRSKEPIKSQSGNKKEENRG